MKLVALVGALALFATACQPSANETTTTTVVPTAPTVGPTTTTLPEPAIPTTADEARVLLWSEDVVLTPEQVRTAGILTEGHYIRLPFPRLFLEGDEAMREAVLDVLALPTARNAQILVAMTLLAEPVAPGVELAEQLASLRDEVLAEVFGEEAQIAQALMVSLIYSETSDELPGPWYDIPSVVGSLEGSFDGSSRFEGVVGVGSDTGERSDYTVEAWFLNDGWEMVGGTWLQLVSSVPEMNALEELTMRAISLIPDAAHQGGEPSHGSGNAVQYFGLTGHVYEVWVSAGQDDLHAGLGEPMAEVTDGDFRAWVYQETEHTLLAVADRFGVGLGVKIISSTATVDELIEAGALFTQALLEATAEQED